MQGLYIVRLTIALCLAVAGGCGLNGLEGVLLQIDGSYYLLKESSGKETKLLVDDRTRKDEVAPGDRIQVYATSDGHAEFIQRLNK